MLSYYPTPGTTLLSSGTAQFTFLFSENVRINSGNIYIVSDSDSNTTVIDVTGPLVTLTDALVPGEVRFVTVTLPPNALADGKVYHVEIDPSTFLTTSLLPYLGIGNNATWNFSTSGGTYPSYTLSPENNARGVSPSLTTLQITFSENVVIGSGSLTVLRENDFSPLTLPATSLIHVWPSRIVTVPLTPWVTSLGSGKSYIVNFDANCFRSFVGFAVPALSSSVHYVPSAPAQWYFITSGALTPVATPAPPAGSVSVEPGTSLLNLSFSENVRKGNGSITIVLNTRGTQSIIDVTSSEVTISGTLAQIAVPPLQTGSSYYVTVDPFVFESFAERFFLGYSSRFQWAFLTAGACAR